MSAQATDAAAVPAGLDSLFQMLISGGPIMVPLFACSVVALAYAVERWLRLGRRRLGTRRFGEQVVREAEAGGASRALALCETQETSLARVLRSGLRRWDRPFLELEKVVEDAGAREVRELSANLRPLVVVAMIAPLLGLLGTVWGMIGSFSNLGLDDSLVKQQLLAAGISQALITTAAGLSIAIPVQAAYYYFKSRIDGFVRNAEGTYARLVEVLSTSEGLR